MDGFRSVVCHPYRSARVTKPFLKLPREHLGDLERKLADDAGVRMDNHTCYTVDLGFTHSFMHIGSPQVIHIMFSDSAAIFGYDIEVKGW